MKKYKFITIKGAGEFNNKPLYQIVNNKSNSVLGSLYYYKRWKQYVFTQYDDSVIFNKDCLLNIVDFIENHVG